MKTILALAAAACASIGLAAAMDVHLPAKPDPGARAQALFASKISMTAEERLALAYPDPPTAIMARIAALDFSADLSEGAPRANRAIALAPTLDNRTSARDQGDPVFGFAIRF